MTVDKKDYMDKYRKRILHNDGTMNKIKLLGQLIEEGKEISTKDIIKSDPTLSFELDSIDDKKFNIWVTKCVAVLEENYVESTNIIRFKSIVEKTIDCDVDSFSKLLNILIGLYEFEQNKTK